MTATPGKPLAVITGLTASGKSELALELCRHFARQSATLEIVCCDSMLVYKGLDIGTDKPNPDVRREIPHHLLDVIAIEADFTVGDYLRLARRALTEIWERGNQPLVVGGTGLYLRALTQGLVEIPEINAEQSHAYRARRKQEVETTGSCREIYHELARRDPDSARTIHPNDLYRITRALEVLDLTGKTLSAYQDEHRFSERPFDAHIVAIDWPRTLIYERIEKRIDRMLEQGLEAELQTLLQQGVSPQARPLQALAYRYFLQAARGDISRDAAIEKTKKESRHFAKRQATWFRRQPELQWLKAPQALLEQATRVFAFLTKKP